MCSRTLCLVATMALGLAASPTATAVNIEIDDPTFTLKTVDTTSIEFGSAGLPPIPADFFYPGSDPFTGIVIMQGEPVRPGDNANLIIRGQGPLVLPPAPSTASIPIELVEMKLVSSAPISVTGTAPHDGWVLARGRAGLTGTPQFHPFP